MPVLWWEEEYWRERLYKLEMGQQVGCHGMNGMNFTCAFILILGNHEEDREMECCHYVLVGGDQFAGIHKTHPYISGEFKKIGVCDGRSLYQHRNNTEIFMYYVCGRWFIGLEVTQHNCF